EIPNQAINMLNFNIQKHIEDYNNNINNTNNSNTSSTSHSHVNINIGRKTTKIETPRYMGKVHTTEYVMKISHDIGEVIICIEGTYKEWIESLTIVTNKQKHTFGTINNAPSYNVNNFICDVPMGNRIVGFKGGFGFHLHYLAFVHQPVSIQGDK